MARKSRFKQEVITTPVLEPEWRVALYLRLSVEDGDDVDQNSIGNQRKICMSHLEGQDDLKYIHTYMDHGYSGMSYKRPGFLEMYDAVVRGDINCIIVKDISRFGREYLATSEYLQITFPAMGVRFISVNDDYDSLTPNVDIEGLLLPFKLIVNDAYAKDTSTKIRSSINAKMDNGDYLPSSSSIPYGYFRNSEKNSYDVDAETAPIVERIFEMRAEGMAFNAIAKTLNAENIPSPGKLRYMRGMTKDPRFEDAQWIRGTIRKMTNSSVYLGNRIHGTVKSDCLGEAKTRRSSEEWQIIEDAHPAIISASLFQKVQEVNAEELERREHFHTHEKPSVDFRDVLKDKLYCGDCGARMIPMKRNQRLTSDLPPELFYQCNNYQYSNKQKCFNHYTPQALILSTLQKVIDHQVEVAADFEAAMQSVSNSKQSPSALDSSSLKSIQLRRKNLEAKLERALMDLADGILSRDEYDYVKRQYALEHSSLLEEEKAAEKENAKRKETILTACQWLESIKRYHKIPVIDKALVDLLIDKIVIYSDNRVQVILNYSDPFRAFSTLLSQEVDNDEK